MGLPKIEGDDNNNVLNGQDIAEEIRGRRGDDTLTGNGGNDRLIGDKGNDILSGGDGNDRLKGGAGDDDLTGGAGVDRFTFDLRGGTDTVNDYTDEIDRLDFTNFSLGTFDNLISHAAQVGSDTVFTMDGGEVMILKNVLLSNLDAGDFRI